MADAQEVALSDEEVFGAAVNDEGGARVNLSPLERAVEQIAEGARSEAFAAAKSTIDEAASRFERVIREAKDANAEAVVKAVEAALEKISAGTRMDTSTIREIVGAVKMPDLAPLGEIRAELERVGKLVEGTHGAIAGSIRALREELLEAMRTELKVEVKAPERERQLYRFDINYNEAGDMTSVNPVPINKSEQPPRTALEAAQRGGSK